MSLAWLFLFGLALSNRGLAAQFGNDQHDDFQFVAQCRIFNKRGELLKMAPGDQCLFFQNGSYVSVDVRNRQMLYTDRQGREIWKKSNVRYHHELSLSGDAKRILVLKSEVARGRCGRVRYDGFEVVELATGRTLLSWSLKDHLDEVEAFAPPYLDGIFTEDARTEVDCEISHFNSLYEIPENPIAKNLPALSKGNYIAGFNRLNSVVIFDSKLRNILWKYTSPDLREIHDVQVLPTGRILIYNNEVIMASGQPRIAIQILDPVTRKLVFSYQPGDSTDFHARVGGGVQWLPDGFLFNSNGRTRTGWVYFVSHLDHKVKWSFSVKGQNEFGTSILGCKEQDLRSFLRNTSL